MNRNGIIPTPDKKSLRNFGYLMAVAMVILFGLAMPWITDHRFTVWPWPVAMILAGLGHYRPHSLAPLFRLWMRLGLAISRVTTPLILGVVFFVVITPFGAVMRMFGWDPLAREQDSDCESYRVTSEQPEPGDMERPF